MKYKSIFFSDTHIGARNSDVTKLLDFLKEVECDCIFIVGDFIDGWELKHKWTWNVNNNILIQKLLRKSRKGTDIKIIYGNHDDFFAGFENYELGNITIHRQYVHTTVTNQKYLIIHGDQFDGIIKYAKWLQHIGSHLYNIIIDINTFINRLIRKSGKTYSFAKTIKQNSKNALNFLNKFEECVVIATKQNECMGVICGHVHTSADKEIDGIRYLNTGSWQENEFHVIVETLEGEIKLLTL
jgi:UDP-2,3-diacylglucosamine pyrophosphatase LpxH